ncbi:exo-beta-1,3-glucanase [Fomitiporia mediterranea MF3/22]|uniref:exo-beta-1,3-glucanase n=1 Tax=Fomitiporia mediterranea (strain MF3/22) TaxID=694068 RepID=UPI0004408462|nr:exo-beta-1,3-glucanase [Fomitiporia mediterranea MF3/22]EJD00408.1 exo-beta-1,3-glucanase [Fomitiporia mediterranea MF3/22]
MPRLSSTLLFIAGSALLSHCAPLDARGKPFNYGVDKIYGVNIGGWLLLEPWITPSLFDNTGNPDIIDEWTFTQLQDRQSAQDALKQHWDTFFTEKDFADIAAAGLNHVRVPIGYWAFDVADDEPFIKGQVPYLKKAIEWSGKYGLNVVIDLHGAPGSQNGFDNSGRKLDFPTWQLEQQNIDRTNAVLKTISDIFAPQADVANIIAPLNEPAGFNGTQLLDVTRNYWLSSYDTIRHPQKGPSDRIVLIHDAFMNSSYWGDFMTPPKYSNVVMDTHQYQIFSTDGVALSEDDHIKTACNFSNAIKQFALPIIVGEWSPASTDCARYLNGRRQDLQGARYDGTYPDSTFVGLCLGKSGSAKYFSDDYKTFLRKYWEAQAKAYETSYGWFQWTWKTEEGTGEEWSYSKGIEYGWISQDVTDRKYPDICAGYV